MLACLGATVYSSVGKSNTLVFDESFIAGLGNSVTFVRATTATNEDFEPLLKTIPISGSRHEGARGVRNLVLTTSEDFSNAAWLKQAGVSVSYDATEEAYEVTYSGATAGLYQLLGNADLLNTELTASPMVKGIAGQTIQIWLENGSKKARITHTFSGSWERITSGVTPEKTAAGSSYLYFRHENGVTTVTSFFLRYAQVEDVAGQANQNPGEYVSVGSNNVLLSAATNPLSSSSDLTGADTANATVSATTVSTTSGSGAYVRCHTNNGTWSSDYTTSDTLTLSADVRGIGDSIGKILSAHNEASSDLGSTEIVLTSEYQRISITRTKLNTHPDYMYFDLNITDGTIGNGESVDIKDIQVEHGSLTTYEAVPINHGANIDGLKYFDTENGNGTNLVTYPEDFSNVIWTTLNSTESTDVAVAPDGTTTADELLDDSTNGQHAHRHTYDFVTGLTYTISCYLKKSVRDHGMLAFGGNDLGMGGFDYRRAVFDLTNGTVFFTPTGGAASMESVVDGWYRCIFSIGPIVTGASANVDVYVCNDSGDNSYVGDGSGIYAWGAQLNPGAVAGAYSDTLNVVAEATGSAIAAATTKGIRIEEARTNRADNADALASPDTIDLTADGTGDFTLSVSGTAAVTVAAGTATGTGFGQATAGTPVTFNLSVTGTVTLTLDSGALTQNANGSYEYNLEAGSFATTWIENTVGGTTRDLEEVDGDATLYKDTMTITGEFNSGVDTATGAVVFEFSDGTANNACYFWKDASGNLEMNITVGGVEKYSEVAAWTPGTTKFAIALSTTIGESAVYIDGARLDATPTTDAGHAGLEGTVDEFRIGRWIDDTLALNGTLKNSKIYHELKDATWLAADSTP